MADVVRRPPDLPAAVSRALANPGRHAAARRAVTQALFAYPGRATERALRLVYELLELEHPAGVPERLARDVRKMRGEVRA
jgi:hypothetical protein